MKKVIKNNYKIVIGIIIGIILSITTVYAVEAYIESNKVSFDNKHTKTNNVQDAIDELYERSGIHKEKWVDKELNGADPVLQDPLIPVEIKPNGDVYYANLNSEWYNYSEKKWANAVILNDNVNHNVGDKIDDKEIKGYFVWIPRYQYKVWDMGEYTSVISFGDLKDSQDDATSEGALWKITRNNTRIIDIKFGGVENAPKMNENEAAIDKYYTHPAFTLGEKDLNGIWVGKFETGGTIESPVVKPGVVSLRNQTVKEFFNAGKSFATGLDSHMMKNTEWGAAAYLSHSQYGIGNKVNVNNTSDFYTGYSAAPNADQSAYPGDIAEHTDKSKTQPWDTPVGYLASTTGNISGIYDMSGGAWEYVAAFVKGQVGKSDFDEEELANQVKAGYFDEYPADSGTSTYNKRILGDATGEIGPFYRYYEGDGIVYYHNSWYGTLSLFVGPSFPWFGRGGVWSGGSLAAGQFEFCWRDGGPANGSFRLVLT